MNTVTMTLEQYKKLEYALTLAQYFCEGRDPCEQLDSDQETVDEAMEVIEQIDHPLGKNRRTQHRIIWSANADAGHFHDLVGHHALFGTQFIQHELRKTG